MWPLQLTHIDLADSFEEDVCFTDKCFNEVTKFARVRPTKIDRPCDLVTNYCSALQIGRMIFLLEWQVPLEMDTSVSCVGVLWSSDQNHTVRISAGHMAF